MWIKALMVYRVSFLILVAFGALTTAMDFVVIFVMFGHIDALGGFTLPEVAFLYGTSGFALGVADLVVGNVERVGRRIREGYLDVVMVRPIPALVQLAADNFGFHRIGRILQSSVVLSWALVSLPLDWSIGRVLLVPGMLVCGSVIFCSIFVLGGAFQFAAGDAAEVANAFTYGGNFLTQYPPTIFAREVVLGALFLVPLGFVNWMPALAVLDRPDPLGLPEFLRYASPIAAGLLVVITAIAWRAGVRGYRSTGS